MNNTNTVKALTKGMREANFLSIITTGCVTSLLAIGVAVAPSQAATFTGDVTNVTGGNAYNKTWTFEVTLSDDGKKITFVVKGSNFDGYTYVYDAQEDNGKYSFDGNAFDTIHKDNNGNNKDKSGVKMKGVYTPNSNTLTIENPISSGGLTFNVNNITFKPSPNPNPNPNPNPDPSDEDPDSVKIPESSCTITLLAFGILGTGAIVKRHLKSAKTSQKQSEQNSSDYPQREVSKVS
jgi:hypothetical protein